MSKEQPKILFAGGGTGGHLFPALAIAGEIRKLQPDVEILFVGTRDKIEARVVPQQGYAFATIWISGFHRRLTVDNLLFPVKVMISYAQSISLLSQFQPDVVVGTGGYVCGPVLYAATRRKIPTVVHESNSYPGVTTRLLAHRANRVFTACDATSRWLQRKDNIERIGTPVRNPLRGVSRKKAATFFGLQGSKKTVLAFGGSLGAASLNSAVKRMLSGSRKRDFQLIWQTGEKQFSAIQAEIGQRKGVWVGPFIERMDYAYAAADLVVCRAGAMTIAELTSLGKASILVPLPHAAAHHQTHNAMMMVEAGAAKLVQDKDVAENIEETIKTVLADGKGLKRMGKEAAKLGRPKAAEEIARKVLALIPKQG